MTSPITKTDWDIAGIADLFSASGNPSPESAGAKALRVPIGEVAAGPPAISISLKAALGAVVKQTMTWWADGSTPITELLTVLPTMRIATESVLGVHSVADTVFGAPIAGIAKVITGPIPAFMFRFLTPVAGYEKFRMILDDHDIGLRSRFERWDASLMIWEPILDLVDLGTLAQTINGVPGSFGFGLGQNDGDPANLIWLDTVSMETVAAFATPSLFDGDIAEGFEDATWRDRISVTDLNAVKIGLALDGAVARPGSVGTSSLKVSFTDAGQASAPLLYVPYAVHRVANNPLESTYWARVPSTVVGSAGEFRVVHSDSGFGSGEHSAQLGLNAGNLDVALNNSAGVVSVAAGVDTYVGGDWFGVRVTTSTVGGNPHTKIETNKNNTGWVTRIDVDDLAAESASLVDAALLGHASIHRSQNVEDWHVDDVLLVE